MQQQRNINGLYIWHSLLELCMMRLSLALTIIYCLHWLVWFTLNICFHISVKSFHFLYLVINHVKKKIYIYIYDDSSPLKQTLALTKDSRSDIWWIALTMLHPNEIHKTVKPGNVIDTNPLIPIHWYSIDPLIPSSEWNFEWQIWLSSCCTLHKSQPTDLSPPQGPSNENKGCRTTTVNRWLVVIIQNPRVCVHIGTHCTPYHP